MSRRRIVLALLAGTLGLFAAFLLGGASQGTAQVDTAAVTTVTEYVTKTTTVTAAPITVTAAPTTVTVTAAPITVTAKPKPIAPVKVGKTVLVDETITVPFDADKGDTVNVIMSQGGDMAGRCADMGGALKGNVCQHVDF